MAKLSSESFHLVRLDDDDHDDDEYKTYNFTI